MAHYLERGGIPKTQISLLRKHTEGIRPPRALFVPFELGRPFGPPNKPELQQRVLLDVLCLLEQNDGPILEDFTSFGSEYDHIKKDIEGWSCPVKLEVPHNDLNDIQKLTFNLKQEIKLLRPWYKESIAAVGGRRLDGLTSNSPEEIVDLLVSFIKNPKIESFLTGQTIGRALKLSSDDLKHFYFQSAMARPKSISDGELGNWFYGETLGGKLLIKIRSICLNHESKTLQLIGRTNFVPNAMLKYV